MTGLPRFAAKVLASGFGTGFAPLAPGTAGSAAALGVLAVLHALDPLRFPGSPDRFMAYAACCAGLFFAGVWAARTVQPVWGEDPGRVVIDEWCGMWIAMIAVPWTWTNLLAAFLLFRFFDIVKPVYIRRMEGLGGGLGVMMDDALAGVYANLLVQAGWRIGWL